VVDFKAPIARDGATGKLSQYGSLHWGSKGAHIVPHFSQIAP
jgi:hypothetical protein